MSKNFNALSPIDQYKIRNHVTNLVKLSNIDGKFSKSEAETLLHICERYGLPRVELLEILNKNESSEYIIPAEPMEKLDQIYDFVRIILADKKIDTKELDLCKHIAEELHIASGVLNDLILTMVDFVQQGKTFDQVKEQLFKIAYP